MAARGVTVRFGGLVALDDASVTVTPSTITGLIGPNGAGKTTMFNVCCGFQRANAGAVTLFGQDVTDQPPSRRARLGLGRTFQRMELFGSMTVRENIEVAAEAEFITEPLSQLGLRRAGRAQRQAVTDRADSTLERIGLEGIARRVAGELPVGQGRLVELARALARSPRVLLLDEPSSGLDRYESRVFGEQLQRLAAEGLAILMVEHDISLVLGICDWIYVLEFGKPLASGTAAEIRADAQVRAAYLGREVA